VLGHVAGDGQHWEALSPSGKLIGTFKSWAEAANAIPTTASAKVGS
jgi:hypothetical protein